MDSARVQDMADEVAALMASRFGGLRRGQQASLAVMLRRRGAALPRKLRRDAIRLAEAEALSMVPRIARQRDGSDATRAHAALVRHLKQLGALSRWQARGLSVAATVALGLLLVAAAAVWLIVWRGYV